MINDNQFLKSLKEVIKKNDEVIIIYSNLSQLLNKFKFNNNLLPHVLDLIENFVTQERTLILPSYSAKIFVKTKKFDIKNTIDNIGVLSKEALKRNYYRTPQPLYSHLILGKKKKEIQKLTLKTSWGEGSIFDFLSKNDARICTIDIPWNRGCAYLHKFEEDFQVPWRYFKKYTGKMYLNKKFISECEETKYSLPYKYKDLYDYAPFIKYIKKSKSFLKNTQKEFKIESVKTSCLNKIAHNTFSKDPWCIIKKKKTFIELD